MKPDLQRESLSGSSTGSIEKNIDPPPAPKPFVLPITPAFYKEALRLMSRAPEALARKSLSPSENISAAAGGTAGPDFDTAINAMLAEIGRLLQVSRVYVMIDEEDGCLLRNTHEWVDGGIGAAMYSWPLHDYERDVPSLKPLMADKDFFAGHTRDMPPDLKRMLSKQAVSSLLLVPLRRDGIWVGLMGFDSCGKERLWQEEEMFILRHMAGLVALFMERHEYVGALHALQGIRELLWQQSLPVRWASLPGITHKKTPQVPGDARSLQDVERSLIMEALTRYKGNKARAARHLGLKWAALDRRCKKLGITKE